MFSNKEGHLEPVSATRNYPDVCMGIMWEHFFVLFNRAGAERLNLN